MPTYLDKYWLIITGFLVVSLICGGIFLVVKQVGLQPIEISLATSASPELSGDIYVGGAVANPGFYPAKNDDTLATLIQAAGLVPEANLSDIKVYVPRKDENQQPQKINLNRAETWLLTALPGIGQGKAQDIVDYRSLNGPFRSTADLLKIQGFGTSTLAKIKDLITVED